MNPIDPLRLQRLVDGELNNDQVQQLLQQANNNPEAWQEIALGFIEDQLWAKSVRASQSTGIAPPLGNAILDPGALTPDTGNHVELSQPQMSQPQTEPSRRGVSWLTIAASLMIAGFAGYFVNEMNSENSGRTPLVDHITAPPVNQVERDVDQEPALSNPTYHLELPSDDSELGELAGYAGNSRVPLFSVRNGDQAMQHLNRTVDQSDPPIELINRMHDSGYEMKRDIEFISGQFEDGRTFVLPVRTIRFVPGQ